MATLPFTVYEEPINWAAYGYFVAFDTTRPAIQKNANSTVFEGVILFTYDQHGWRVYFVQTRPVLFTTVRLWPSKILVIAGHFNKKLRAGNFCKRPHKLISQYHSA